MDLVSVSESWARKSQPIEDVLKMDNYNYTVICNTNLRRQIDGTPAIIVNSSKFIDIEEDRYKFVDDLTLGTNLLFAQPNFFFLEIPQGPLGISIGNIQSAQKAFRVPQSSVFCHFPCFIEISPKNGICSQSRIFWPIFKCHTILESY